MAKLNEIKKLSVRWSTSKARDTYGYNICKIIDHSPEGKVFKTYGGGYDMLGTVLADWVQHKYQTELMLQADKAHNLVIDNRYQDSDIKQGFYGMIAHYKDNALTKIVLDGGCGINSIERIMNNVLGLTLERVYSYDRQGRVKDTIGFYVYPTE